MPNPDGLDSYISGPRSTRRPTGSILVVAAIAALFGLVGVLGLIAVSQPSTADTAQAPAGPTDSVPPEVLEAASARLDARIASGWVPFEDNQPYAGDPVSGWVPMGADAASLLPAFDSSEHRLPVFASQGGGDVLGYVYNYVGFVPAALADSETFSASAARSERVGCDPIGPDGAVDAECAARWNESQMG